MYLPSQWYVPSVHLSKIDPGARNKRTDASDLILCIELIVTRIAFHVQTPSNGCSVGDVISFSLFEISDCFLPRGAGRKEDGVRFFSLL
jgi:hypothetical protein